jgi:hypothetical protein
MKKILLLGATLEDTTKRFFESGLSFEEADEICKEIYSQTEYSKTGDSKDIQDAIDYIDNEAYELLK